MIHEGHDTRLRVPDTKQMNVEPDTWFTMA